MGRRGTIGAGLTLSALVWASSEAVPGKIGDLPRSFERAPDGRFVHRGPGFEATLEASTIRVTRDDGSALTIALGAAVPAGGIEGIELLVGRAYYFDEPARTLYAGVRYAGVRAGIDLDVRAIDAGLELHLSSSPGAFAGPVALDVVDTRTEGARELRFDRSGIASIEIAPLREPHPPTADRVRLAVGADGARYLAGRSRDREAFVAKIAPDGTTLLWVSRFPLAEGDRVKGVALLEDGRVAMRGGSEREGWRAMVGADGSVIPLERGLEIACEAERAIPSRFGPASRIDAVVPSRTGGSVLAGATSERRLPDATIVVPLGDGDSVFLATAAGCPGTINFDNSAGTGLWGTASNWDLDRLPNATDDVCIPGGFGVTITSGTHAILSLTTAATASFHMTGGTLTVASASAIGGDATMTAGTWNGAGDVTIAGPFTWSGGTLGGGGTTTANGGITAGGVTFKDLNPRTLRNTATVSWTGGGVRLGNGSIVQNDGTWEAQADGTMSALSGGGTFLNAGTLRKSGGAGTTTIDVQLSSAGAVDVQSGTLSFNAGGSASGPFTGSAGTALRFAGGTMTIAPPSTIAVATARFDSGTIDIGGSYAASSGTQVGGGNVTFNASASVTAIGSSLTISSGSASFQSGETIAPSTLTLSGGSLSGTDTVTVSGLLTWSGGSMTGGGTTTANGGIAMSGNFKDLNPRVLQSSATATWAGTGGIRLGGGSQIKNTGTWEAAADASMSALAGSGTFVNDGTFRKTGGTGITSIAVPFDSAGGVALQSGSLRLTGGGTGSGTFTGSAGTTLRFGSGYTLTPSSSLSVDAVEFEGGTLAVNGTYSAVAGTTVSGSTVTFGASAQLTSIGSSLSISSGTVSFGSGETVAPVTLTLSGGTLSGSDLVDVSGATTWTAGSMTGGAITRASGGLAFSGSGFKDSNPRTIHVPAGKAATWTGTGIIRLGGGSTIQNDGTWECQSDTSILPLSGGGTFVNAGTLRKSAGSLTTSIGIAVDSAGSVQVQSGTLELAGGGTASGTFTGSTGTTLRFGGGTFDLGTTSSVAVASAAIASGTVTVNGAYAATTATTIGGNASFSSTSTVTSVGALTVQGGTAAFSSGETILPATMTFLGGTLTGTDTVEVAGLLTWSTGTMTGGGTTRALGGMLLNGSSFCDLSPRTLRSAGASQWTGGSIRLGGGSLWINDGIVDLQTDGIVSALPGGGTIANGGTFRKSAGIGTTQVGVPFTSTGDVEALSHTIEFLSGFTQTAGGLTLNGGTVVAPAPLSIQGGSFRGTGATGVGVNSAGTTSPGLSPGILGVTGSWSQSSAGTLAVELGGTAPGTQHDRLDVSGTATIDGALAATFTGGYVPVTGDTFTILTAGTRSGTFASTTLPALGPGQFWNVIYKPASVELKIVPAPSGRIPGDLASESPLRLAKAGSDLKLDWSAGCVATDVDSEIYEGALGGNFTSHVPVVCSTGGAVTWTFPPSAGSRYYLVVPTNGAGEGSYGFSAPGVERPFSGSACRVQALAPCP